MPRRRSVITKKPRKKISDCNEHVTLMRTIKGRLLEISLKVDNYIYKQKPIAKLQAKAYLREITSYKSHCQNDIGYLQVIEKLTRYMNIIISDNTTKTPVNDINSNVKVIETPNNSTLPITNENLQTPTDNTLESINQDNIQHPIRDQNNLGLTLHNAPTSGSLVTSKNKYENDKQCLKKEEKINIIKETMDLEKDEVTNISSKVLQNGGRVESNNEINLSQTANIVESAVNKDNNKATTNNDQALQIENKVQNSPKNDYRFLICVDGGVIHEIQHLSNATVVHQVPEVHIPLNEFVLNNTKTPNTSSYIKSKVIQNNIRIKSGKEEKNVPEIDKPRGKKTNNKKVKFTAPYIDLTENAKPNNSKSDEENNKNKVDSILIANNSEISIFLKERPENDNTKNKERNKIKESRPMNDKKTKQPAIKRKVNKRNNISNNQDTGRNDKKPQVPANKRKINERETIAKNNLLKEIKSNSNDLSAQNDLSWFDSIKYVRKIDEQEYFKPLQPLDDNFWCNPGLILSDDREFTIL